MKTIQAIRFGHLRLVLAILSCTVLPTIATAGEKRYPVEGTVTALGVDREPLGSGRFFEYRTYTVNTSRRTFVLKCPNDLNAILGKRDCGGKEQIEIGDTLHLRVEKRFAYLQRDKGKEQKLEVLSETAKQESEQ
jgi:hypothetical protein